MADGVGRRFPRAGVHLAFSDVRQQLTYEGPARVWHHRARSWRMAVSHQHADLEVNLAVEGRAAYLIDGRRVPLVPGDLLFLHAGEDHLLVDESADFRMWIAVWRPATVAAAVRAGLDAEAAAERPRSTELRRLAAAELTRLARLFADVVAAEGAEATLGQSYLLWRCRSAFARAADIAWAAAHPAVARAAQLLRADPGQPLSALACAVGLSDDRLGKVFRAEAGLTLVDYRTRLRLERVAAAWTPGADLLRLALDAGFGSYSAFNRAFRRRFGHAPRDFLARAAVGDRVLR